MRIQHQRALVVAVGDERATLDVDADLHWPVEHRRIEPWPAGRVGGAVEGPEKFPQHVQLGYAVDLITAGPVADDDGRMSGLGGVERDPVAVRDDIAAVCFIASVLLWVLPGIRLENDGLLQSAILVVHRSRPCCSSVARSRPARTDSEMG